LRIEEKPAPLQKPQGCGTRARHLQRMASQWYPSSVPHDQTYSRNKFSAPPAAQALGNSLLGEFLANAGEITEGVSAFLEDTPVTSLGSAAGAGFNMLRNVACHYQNDRPWYCF
jgi:hypothetical protein